MEDQHINNGAYDLEGVIWHQHSNKLMVEILKLWPDKEIPVLDIGCGHNFYVGVLNYAGYKAEGVGGEDLGSQYFYKKDVTTPLRPFGNPGPLRHVLSFEVGEHIPADLDDGYLDNLARFGGDVLMSWAVPGQAGIGHINCKSNDWVIAQMEKRGLKYQHEKSMQLRSSIAGCHCTWFQNTLMYFSR